MSITQRYQKSGDNAFLSNSVACVADDPRGIFAADATSAVLASSCTLLSELSDEHLLPVNRAWELIEEDSWPAYRWTEFIMRLVISLRTTHDSSPRTVLAHPDGG